MSKLLSKIRSLVARKASKDVSEVNELLHTIKIEVEAREASDLVKIDENRRQNMTPTAGAFTTGSKNVPPIIYDAFIVVDYITQCHVRKWLVLKSKGIFYIEKGDATTVSERHTKQRISGIQNYVDVVVADIISPSAPPKLLIP